MDKRERDTMKKKNLQRKQRFLAVVLSVMLFAGLLPGSLSQVLAASDEYEDCCTVFTPRHPRTKPKLRDVLRAEQSLDEEALLADALSKVETMFTYPER